MKIAIPIIKSIAAITKPISIAIVSPRFLVYYYTLSCYTACSHQDEDFLTFEERLKQVSSSHGLKCKNLN
jgi:hypothetical protein